MSDQKIVAFLKTRQDGATLSEISLRTGHGRATVGKYLEMLKLEGKADFRGIGRAKVWFLSQAKKPKIVIVDDEPGLLKLLRLTLGEHNYEIIEARDGLSALEKVNENMPDLIILDIMLPRLDGMEVCRRIKENVFTRKIPVIMLTAKEELDSRIKGIQLGADDYVSKPFDVLELRERVRAMLSKPGDRNPVTNLLNLPLVKEKARQLSGREGVIVIGFENIEKYAKRNGRIKENEFLKIMSQILAHSTQSAKNSILGHLNDREFIVVCRSEDTTQLSRSIRESVEEILPYIHSGKETRKETITARISAPAAGEIKRILSP